MWRARRATRESSQMGALATAVASRASPSLRDMGSIAHIAARTAATAVCARHAVDLRKHPIDRLDTPEGTRLLDLWARPPVEPAHPAARPFGRRIVNH